MNNHYQLVSFLTEGDGASEKPKGRAGLSEWESQQKHGQAQLSWASPNRRMGLRQVEKEGGGWINIFLSEVTSKIMPLDGCLGRTGDSTFQELG